ncbi:MAG: amidophosphoribosyltransferase [Lachnospiraceae bacterium]|nr:amidophosphoribosyltransferase [Lachnospiraceae bacterium]
MYDTIHEECGVFGVFNKELNNDENIAATVYYGLYALQHRGQEGCGIVVNDDGVFSSYKDLGLVSDVFSNDTLKSLGQGSMAIGHVRYSTTGGNNRTNVQPIEVHHIKGSLAIAHNGNLTNAMKLREDMELTGSIFHTTSDTETIAYTIVKERLTTSSIESAVEVALHKMEGAYSLIIMSATKLIAARDRRGMRPLCYGVTEDGSYIVASESCALNAVGATFVRDILPGEILVFSKEGIQSITTHCGRAEKALCIFEYIYFARSDSNIDGVSVQAARLKAGRCLAKSHPVDADIVIGVPDSGLDAALGFAEESGIPYGIGFVKNKYIGRTFISPTQSARENQVRIKLNPIESMVNGKRVVLIDDSIVRGTTSARIVKLLKEAGAIEVHMRISAPPFLNPCYYGTDVDTKENLIANNHSIEEIAEIIGVDSLGYLTIEDAASLAEGSHCLACFTGEYPTTIPSEPAKFRFEQKLSETKS